MQECYLSPTARSVLVVCLRSPKVLYTTFTRSRLRPAPSRSKKKIEKNRRRGSSGAPSSTQQRSSIKVFNTIAFSRSLSLSRKETHSERTSFHVNEAPNKNLPVYGKQFRYYCAISCSISSSGEEKKKFSSHLLSTFSAISSIAPVSLLLCLLFTLVGCLR